jgi:UDP-glucose:(heptosyl)LPS alpha-1,3-glucosyltransferase
MKIAILKSHMSGTSGGLEKVTLGLIKAFIRKNHEVTLLTTGLYHTKPIGAKVVNLGYRSKCALKHHWQFDQIAREYLKQHPHDIVFGLDRNKEQTHYRAGNGVHAVYLKNRLQAEKPLKKLLLRLNPLHPFLIRQEKAAFESSLLRKLFTNSQMVKDQLLENFKIQEDKIIVIQNGIDWTGYASFFAKKQPSKPFKFLFVGNNYKRKGLPQILRALPLLKDLHFELHVVGKDKHRYKAPLNVHFHGPVSNMMPFYQQCHCLLLPSFYDPFANVTLEALAMGLFVITSKQNGGHEVLEDQTGVCIEDVLDIQALAEAMRQSMTASLNPEYIRNSIRHLDFSNQLDKMADLALYD